MTIYRCYLIVSLSVLLFIGSTTLTAQHQEQNRMIVLTDIEADPDDMQSLVRLMLYANQIDIKGIVATTSCWMQSEIHPESIHRVIEAYRQVYPNLLMHESGYPSPDHLRSIVKNGLPKYGMTGVGDGMDSEGSQWIIRELEADDDRPLWISVWGGVNTLAQALHKISATKNATEAERLIKKLRVYTISDQDDSGLWIRNTYPELFYIVSPGDSYGEATWTGINNVVPGIDNSTISTAWFAEHIQQGHGPLGATYPDVSWGVEGDTPAYLSLIPNGLNDPEHPEWGAWGGRYELYQPSFEGRTDGSSVVTIAPETRPIWTNADDRYSPLLPQPYGRAVRPDTSTFEGYKVTLWRWRDDFQHDFAARMDWCTKSYEEANHPPVPVLDHSDRLTVQSGEQFTLSAKQSYDPDGDNLSFYWMIYPEAGSYDGEWTMNQPENDWKRHGTAPQVEEPETIHVILRLTDKGSPALTRYQRIILTVTP